MFSGRPVAAGQGASGDVKGPRALSRCISSWRVAVSPLGEAPSPTQPAPRVWRETAAPASPALRAPAQTRGRAGSAAK